MQQKRIGCCRILNTLATRKVLYGCNRPICYRYSEFSAAAVETSLRKNWAEAIVIVVAVVL